LALLRGAHKLLDTVNGKALEMLLVIVFTYRQHITRECHVRNIPLCYLQYAQVNKQIDHTYSNCIHLHMAPYTLNGIGLTGSRVTDG